MSHYKTREIAPGKLVEFYTLKGRQADGSSTVINLPVVYVSGRAGSGGRLLFTSGIHGDEYEGPYSLLRLAREIDPDKVCGDIIIAPIVNPNALLARRRCSPDDNLDLNRSFPGHIDGLISETIAAFLTDTLLPAADVVLDLHAAGDDSNVVPGTLGHFIDDQKLSHETLSLMKALNTPCALIAEEANADTMWDAQVERAGKIFLTAELGSAARLVPDTMRISWRAVQNALRHLGHVEGHLLPFEQWENWNSPKLLKAPSEDHFIQLPCSGFFAPSVLPGQMVSSGDLIGEIYNIGEPTASPTPIVSPLDGIMYSTSTGGWVTPQNWWTIIGQEADWN